jgi:hypothetical protein
MARSFSCSVILELCAATFSSSISELDYQQTLTFGYVTPYTCMNRCYGSQSWSAGYGYNYSYSTTTSGIVSPIDSGGGSVSVFGVWVGDTGVTAHVSDYYCSVDANPQPPVGVKPSVSISGPPSVPISVSGGATNNVNLTANGAPGGGAYSWSTSNPSFALTNVTSRTVTLSSTATSQSTLTVTYSYGGKTAQASKDITVLVPTTASTTGNSLNTYNGTTSTWCDGTNPQTNSYGYRRCLTYQLNDQSNPPSALAGGYPIHEVIEDLVSNYGSNAITGDSSSNANGVFVDQVGLIGAGSGPPANACAYSRQTFSANSTNIRVNCLHYTATDVTITDITATPSSCSTTCP